VRAGPHLGGGPDFERPAPTLPVGPRGRVSATASARGGHLRLWTATASDAVTPAPSVPRSLPPLGNDPPVTLPVRGDDPPDEYSNFALLLQQFPRWNAKLEYSVPPGMGGPAPHIPLAGESLPHRPLAGRCQGRRLRRRARIQCLPLLVRCLGPGISVAGPVLWEVRSWVAGTLRVVVYNSTGG